MSPLAFSVHVSGRLADGLFAGGLDRGEIQLRRFPDGEAYVRLESAVLGRDVLLLCSLDRADSNILPLLFAADAAREQGARRVGLVAPYLGYMRQDMSFHPGEAITSTTFGRLISSSFDWLLTVDPHLHRHQSLGEIYSIAAEAVTATEPIADWIAAHVQRPYLFGPDEESEQWVAEIAGRLGARFGVFTKERSGDLSVTISGEAPDLSGHTAVIIDDIISSARTMAEAVRLLRSRATAPVCIGVHGIFAGDALQVLRSAGPRVIVTSDSIESSTSSFSVSSILLKAIQDWSLS